MFLRRLLAPDEEVVLQTRPHWRRLVRPAALLPVVVGATSFLLAILPGGSLQADLRWGVLATAVLVLLAGSVAPWLRWRATWYVLTNRRLLVRSGVLRRRGIDIPLYRIMDVRFQRSVVDRLFGTGTLVVDGGAERGDVVLGDVPSVTRVQQLLQRLTDSYAGPAPVGVADGAVPTRRLLRRGAPRGGR